MDSTLFSPCFTIGALAQQVGIPAETIRFYEREGLLPQPSRRASGYRQYDAHAVERVRFIVQAKSLGFTLDEIRDLLKLATDREHGVEGIKRHAAERLSEISQQITRLEAMRDVLAKLVDACPGNGAPECCPILSSIQRGPRLATASSPEIMTATGRGCCSSVPVGTRAHVNGVAA